MTNSPEDLAGTPGQLLAELPAFFCPLPSVVHPHAKELQEAAMAWVDACGLAPSPRYRQTLNATDWGLFAAGVVPHCTQERADWFTRYVHWGAVLDDQVLDAGQTSRSAAAFARAATALTSLMSTPGRPAQADPLWAATVQIAEEAERYASPAQLRRWHEGMRGWMFGVMHQVANTEVGRVPDFDEYLSYRVYATGVPFMVDTQDIANATEIGEGLLHSPAVRAATEMGSLLMGIDNDIISFAKDRAEGLVGQNPLAILARQHGLSLPRALTMLSDIRDAIMLRFLTVTDAIASTSDEDLRRHSDSVRCMVRSNLEFSVRAARYADPARKRPIRITPHTDTPDTPLDYPRIAWWWRLTPRQLTFR
jgi:terpene synthase-like protein